MAQLNSVTLEEALADKDLPSELAIALDQFGQELIYTTDLGNPAWLVEQGVDLLLQLANKGYNGGSLGITRDRKSSQVLL